MYDLHTHILPGIDDGAATIEDAVDMARAAFGDGTRVILATPHRKDIAESGSLQKLKQMLDTLKTELVRQNILVQVLPGMENDLILELPEELAAGRALTMNGTRYVLVELPYFGRPNYLEDTLFKIQVQGLVPVLAHPERIELIQSEPALLARFVSRGMLSQVTAGSILGDHGEKVKRLTHTFLKQGLVHMICSDAHTATGSRGPRLSEGLAVASGLIGEARAKAMVVETPKALLENKVFNFEANIVPQEEPRRWWKLWG